MLIFKNGRDFMDMSERHRRHRFLLSISVQFSKLDVAGSIPVSRFKNLPPVSDRFPPSWTGSHGCTERLGITGLSMSVVLVRDTDLWGVETSSNSVWPDLVRSDQKGPLSLLESAI